MHAHTVHLQDLRWKRDRGETRWNTSCTSRRGTDSRVTGCSRGANLVSELSFLSRIVKVSTDTEEPAQAIYEEPIPQDPVYQEPIPEESVHEEPIPEEPVYEELIPQAPVYEEPIPEEPVYEEPIPEEPIYEEPIPEKDVPEEPIAEELIQGERAAPVEPVRRLASFRVPSRNWGL